MKRQSLTSSMKAAKDKALGKSGQSKAPAAGGSVPAAEPLTDMTTTAIHIRLTQLRLLQDVASYRQRTGTQRGRVSVSDVIRDLVDGRITAADLKKMRGDYLTLMAKTAE
jgi:hypothetical protein